MGQERGGMGKLFEDVNMTVEGAKHVGRRAVV
jgi:hypothetical protein